MGSWNQETGEAHGLGWLGKEVERYNPITNIIAGADPKFRARRDKALQDYVPPSLVPDAPPPPGAAPDMTDARLRQVALSRRLTTGRGLSSTFVSGQGIASQPPMQRPTGGG